MGQDLSQIKERKPIDSLNGMACCRLLAPVLQADLRDISNRLSWSNRAPPLSSGEFSEMCNALGVARSAVNQHNPSSTSSLIAMKTICNQALLAVTLIVTGCTSLNVEKSGSNEYTASGRSAAGMFVNYPKLRADVKSEADKFAAQKGKRAVEVGHSERNRFIPGFPYYEYKFELASPKP